MQAIVTKFLGPTNFRGACVKAECEAGKLTVLWDDGLNSEENHDKAALALSAKLGWDKRPYGAMYRGSPPNSKGYTYVFAAPFTRVKKAQVRK